MNNTNKNPLSYENGFSFGGDTRNRTGDRGVADLCLTAWPCRHNNDGYEKFLFRTRFFGADYGARTRHLDLGKVALYQMS